jgi:hypothetical protein
MGSDAMSASLFTNPGCLDRFRFSTLASSVARLAQRRHVIDVDAELQHH